MQETEVEMVQYPTGRVFSFLSTSGYDWESFELYRILQDVEDGLRDIETDAHVDPEFSYHENRPNAESLEELLAAGKYSPADGSAHVEAGPISGEIDYTTAVSHESDAELEAEFTLPEEYEQRLRHVLGEAGFKDPIIPRIRP